MSLIDPRLMNSLKVFTSRVTIQNYSLVRDAVGGETRTYAALYTDLPCAIAPAQRGLPDDAELHRNDFTRMRIQPVIHSHHCTIQGYVTGIGAEMRAVSGGVTYDILAVEYDSQRTMTRLRLRTVES